MLFTLPVFVRVTKLFIIIMINITNNINLFCFRAGHQTVGEFKQGGVS